MVVTVLAMESPINTSNLVTAHVAQRLKTGLIPYLFLHHGLLEHVYVNPTGSL